MLKDKDIRNLIIIWIVGTLMAFVCGAVMYFAHDPKVMTPGPTPEMATTMWAFDPATTIAELVRVNTAWTIAVIFPFLFAPILTLFYIIVRYNEKNNPVAQKFDENLPLEVFWTVVPAIVLVIMAVPAYGVLRYMERPPSRPDLVIDIVGAQYYWQYTYPEFDVTVTDEGDGREPMVIPVGKAILLNGASYQVNHAWWVPAFGVKFDVIPGRITSSWIRPKKEGFFKGQCAELCGALHAYMLIHVKVVSDEEFKEWLKSKGAVFPPDKEEILNSTITGELAYATVARN